MLRVESGLERHQLDEAPPEQAGPDEQHERQGHLRDHERSAGAGVHDTRPHPGTAVLESDRRDAAHGLQRRHHAEQQPGEQRRPNGGGEHLHIDAHVVQAG